MPTTPLDRLLFVQGGLCFFCEQPLPRADASVEHLFASSKGGSNGDDNCVACCKAVNALLGSMSLKEKFQVVLKQKGPFKCPNRVDATRAPRQPGLQTKPPARTASAKSKIDNFSLVVTNLTQRGPSRPRKLKTLTSTIASIFPKGIAEAEVTALVQELQSTGKVTISNNKVSYNL